MKQKSKEEHSVHEIRSTFTRRLIVTADFMRSLKFLSTFSFARIGFGVFAHGAFHMIAPIQQRCIWWNRVHRVFSCFKSKKNVFFSRYLLILTKCISSHLNCVCVLIYRIISNSMCGNLSSLLTYLKEKERDKKNETKIRNEKYKLHL